MEKTANKGNILDTQGLDDLEVGTGLSEGSIMLASRLCVDTYDSGVLIAEFRMVGANGGGFQWAAPPPPDFPHDLLAPDRVTDINRELVM
ncbi:hypothetical protein E2562_010548 [Oryza meyeriana var. granulata]|uniref:Uncharacterized protein n=1 Tax=Oryza meyeriana var. granulata TaxID=110450 RepID=A0A6G1BV87_9ORYZ|nr:hypothetical protein E2562_010548 [Oryza meyeriana var. granulata]